jgi:hypothetical protein
MLRVARCLVGLSLLLGVAAQADPRSLSPEVFAQEAFAGAPPAPAWLWLSGELKPALRNVLGHDYPALRLRYWRAGQRSVWVLEAIGKERPITAGFSIGQAGVERVRILAYRESRGGEVQHPAFTAQFDGARLTAGNKLDRSIDGIAGATLSVRALTRMTQAALLLHQHVMQTP